MTLMVAHGCVAGALSPIAPTGIIANGLMARMGMSGFERQNYLYNLAGQRPGRRRWVISPSAAGGCSVEAHDERPVRDRQPTAARTAIGLEALDRRWAAIAVFWSSESSASGSTSGWGRSPRRWCSPWRRSPMRSRRSWPLPWSVIVMVCGVTVLTSLLEKTGGIDLFTTILARFATHRSVTGLIALVTGLVSVYSSTSGVVLPAFLPSVPGLVAKLGGGDPLAIASSILIGGHLVDVSPLSTIGALCIASAPVSADRRLLFNQVLAWGLSMSVVGALGCYLAFGRW